MNFFDFASINPERHRSIRRHLLWDVDPDHFDYQKGRALVVERVVQRGDMNDWLTIFNLYGEEGVREEIKKLPYLNAKDMNFVHLIFEIPLNEMKCYTRKRSIDLHWES